MLIGLYRSCKIKTLPFAHKSTNSMYAWSKLCTKSNTIIKIIEQNEDSPLAMVINDNIKRNFVNAIITRLKGFNNKKIELCSTVETNCRTLNSHTATADLSIIHKLLFATKQAVQTVWRILFMRGTECRLKNNTVMKYGSTNAVLER